MNLSKIANNLGGFLPCDHLVFSLEMYERRSLDGQLNHLSHQVHRGTQPPTQMDGERRGRGR